MGPRSGTLTQTKLLLWKILRQRWNNKCCFISMLILPPLIAVGLLMLLLALPPEKTGDTAAVTFPDIEKDSRAVEMLAMMPEPTILYCPNTTEIDRVMSAMLADVRRTLTTFRVQGFGTEEELMAFYKESRKAGEAAFYPAAVVFNVTEGLPSQILYTIRPSSDGGPWHTGRDIGFHSRLFPHASSDYYDRGFVYLQLKINKAIICRWSESACAGLETFALALLRLQQLDVKTSLNYTAFLTSVVLLSLFFLLAMIFQIGEAMREKECQVKEFLKLMGVSDVAYSGSLCLVRLLDFCPYYLVVPLALRLLAIERSSPSLLIALFFLFSVAVIALTQLICTFSSRRLYAYGCAILLWVLPDTVITYLLPDRGATVGQLLLACLSLTSAYSYGSFVYSELEFRGEGATWSNVMRPVPLGGDGTEFSLGHAMLMLLLDTFLMLGLSWYLDKVLPKQTGVRLSWYFCFQKSYWLGAKEDARGEATTSHESVVRLAAHFEDDPPGLPVGVHVEELCKRFRTCVAVRNASLKMFEGQITVLLGHNGAGKTTLMSMLTGFLSPTSGRAYVCGHDIIDDTQAVRRYLGYCPQHNILLESMTVRENVRFFAELKGGSGQRELDLCERLGLGHVLHVLAQHLSGGQKRMLSVAVALCGGSKAVILDEPSSGMDPDSRQHLWGVLKREREGRAMLLTTHYMDEADALGDRIAIMADAQVRCCGSPLFLKRVFGSGTQLVLVKGPDFSEELVQEAVLSVVPTAHREGEHGAEVSYRLPSHQSAAMPALLALIRERSPQLGVSSFGVLSPTIEEVFFKVEESEDPRYKRFSMYPPLPALNQRLEFETDFDKITGCELWMTHFKTMLIKRMLVSLRNRLVTCVQILLPILLVVLVVALPEREQVPLVLRGPEPRRVLDLRSQPRAVTAFSVNRTGGCARLLPSLADRYQSLFCRRCVRRLSQHIATFTRRARQLEGAQAWLDKYLLGAHFRCQQPARRSAGPGEEKVELLCAYNPQHDHTLPTSLAYCTNAVVKTLLPDEFSITTAVHPLPVGQQLGEREAGESKRHSDLAQVLMLGLSFILGAAGLTAVKERVRGAKHLQRVCGVRPLAFWSGALCWDLLLYLLPTTVNVIIMAAEGLSEFSAEGYTGTCILFFLVLGPASLTYMYTLQAALSSRAAGFLVGFMIPLFSDILWEVYNALQKRWWIGMLDWPSMILLPPYCFLRALNLMPRHRQTRENCLGVQGGKCQYTEDILSTSEEGVGRQLTILLLQSIFWFLFILALDLGFFQPLFHRLSLLYNFVCDNATGNRRALSAVAQGECAGLPPDQDVEREYQRVAQQDQAAGDTLVLRKLCKLFGRQLAVDDVSLGVAPRECFGLLGKNGAGKTTCFKMITGLETPSSGEVLVNGLSVLRHQDEVLAMISYCPQFDGFLEELTGQEVLMMACGLCGVPPVHQNHVVSLLLEAVGLDGQGHKVSRQLSGGNKRKLSLALALVGAPSLVLLDEPSTGMDPAARRYVWKVLAKARLSGKTLVLTSHSMEECEALCTRIGVMVNGSLVCLGSPQHLKSKFSRGYTVNVKMADGVDCKPLSEYFMQVFPGTQTIQSFPGYMHLQIKDPSIPLSQIFRVMEWSKTTLGVFDYNVHQTSLEQVFLTLAQMQTMSAR